MFTKMLVPQDGADEADAILPYVSQLARRLDVPLVLLPVVDGSITGASKDYFSLFLEQAEKAARNRVEPILARLTEDGLRTEAEVTSGDSRIRDSLHRHTYSMRPDCDVHRRDQFS